ncbi:MAG: hypothetical protein ACP5D1_08200 [Bacteroidales bacterium]
MKKYILFTGMFLLLAGLTEQHALSQGVLRKLREKAQDEIIKKALGEEESETPPAQDPSRPGMSNTQGGGLSTEIPDVTENIRLAQTAYGSKNYRDARYSARQALLGVEMTMGHRVLENLPETVGSLQAVTEEDQVASTGTTLVGLTIERVYRSDNQELRITIGNHSALLSATGMYFSSGGMTTTEEGQKVIQFQGHRAVIEYDDHTGYTLSVPFGQSSLMIVNGVNFGSEGAMMDAAGKFDLNNIKKQLGEQ